MKENASNYSWYKFTAIIPIIHGIKIKLVKLLQELAE